MNVESKIRPATLLAAALFCAGCAGHIAPPKWLSTPEEQQQLAYGAWSRITYVDDGVAVEANGELIAADSILMYVLSPQIKKKYPSRRSALLITDDLPRLYADTVHILAQDSIIAINIVKITKGRLVTYDARGSVIGAWTALGAVSCVSHGVAGGISMPVWILVGSIATSAQGYSAVQSHPPVAILKFRQYARFPQGLPDGIDLTSLRPKKREVRSSGRRRRD